LLKNGLLARASFFLFYVIKKKLKQLNARIDKSFIFNKIGFMADYSIKDLEKVTGIKAHTIRIWEKRYAIVQPSRSDTNIRSYSDEDLKKLLNISLLNRNGMKISKLAKLSNSELQNKVMDLAEKPEDSDTKIEALLMAMIDLNEEDFQLTLNAAIDKFGFEKAFLNVVRPFLNKAGILWITGTINPAQEHFVSNMIRQKIDRLYRSYGKTFVA
jgi:DNA-binding transcriptional MerR regulator